MKVCSHCKTEKEESSFSKNRSSNDGLHWWCKECNNPYQRASYQRRRPKALERKRAYVRIPENRLRENARKNTYYRERMTEVFELLGNRCALCPVTDKRLLQIDHVNGGGNQQRKRLNNAWWKIIAEVTASIERGEHEYRLLCANCNWLAAIENGHRKSIWHNEALAAISN
jgi:hypothetical protein